MRNGCWYREKHETFLDFVLDVLYLLVENRDATEGPAHPFRIVPLEFGVDRVQERSHEGQLPGRSNNGALASDIANCRRLSARVLSRHVLD